MKILVPVKRVVDPYVNIRVGSRGVELENIKMSINPFDEIALEQALCLREQNLASEVIVVTIGNDNSKETLRHALALGACRAILVKSEKHFCSLDIARILCQIVKNEQPELVLMGKQSIDGDNNQTPQMLAGLLDWSQATFASGLTLRDGYLEVTRELDGGLETLGMKLPAVVSADLRLKQPRYASLPNIMKAKTKRLDIIEQDTVKEGEGYSVEVVSVRAPSVRSGGVILDSVEALMDKLQHEVKVLS